MPRELPRERTGKLSECQSADAGAVSSCILNPHHLLVVHHTLHSWVPGILINCADRKPLSGQRRWIIQLLSPSLLSSSPAGGWGERDACWCCISAASRKFPRGRSGKRVEGKQRNMAMRQREEEGEEKDSFETEGFRTAFGCLFKFLAPARHPSSPVLVLSGVNNGLQLVGLTNEEREGAERKTASGKWSKWRLSLHRFTQYGRGETGLPNPPFFGFFLPSSDYYFMSMHAQNPHLEMSAA